MIKLNSALKKISLFSTGCLIFLAGTWSHADDVYTIVVKKQEVKDKYRWSLSDWLDTRDRMRLQDLWLSLHSPTPFEFYIGGNYQFNQQVSGNSFQGGEIYFTAFSTFVGLEARYETGLGNRLFGIFDFRIFGFNDQSTNITLQFGYRNNNQPEGSFGNFLAGGYLTFYLTRFFGLEGLFRYFFASSSSSFGQGYSGHRYQGGGFIDFRFVRIYVDYFKDAETFSTTHGLVLGTKLYF